MKNIEKKIDTLTKSILQEEKVETNKVLLAEMKKIGIEQLPYAYSSLKSFIDSETMDVHYNKHYKGYVDKLNKALSKKDYGDVELENIVRQISKYNKAIRNNAGGAFNHALFWKMLSPKTQKPSGKVLEKIKSDFGSYIEFKKQFEEKAKERFGSGWVWLVLTKRNTLKILTTANQDNPLMNVVKGGGYPILGLDLWEHAYYLKYRNKRDEYISNFWKVINWEFVTKLYEMKLKTKMNESVVMKKLITEGKSERCSREKVEEIRMIFNMNPAVKKTFRYGIDAILKSVFPDNWYSDGEYAEGSMSGIFDLEGKGRSVINKLNTNYNAFCVLYHDLNSVLKFDNKPQLQLVGLPPFQQISETKKFIKFLDEYKDRIFSSKSGTFQNIMSILGSTNKAGDVREDAVVASLKNKFGEKNVKKIGELGAKSDMLMGVDCIITIDGEEHTAQIKPYKSIKVVDENTVSLLDTGQVKRYSTDWIIFQGGPDGILVFDNSDTKIIDGNFTFDKNNLIYTV
jgi:Fe-Mn family superoxide dismutase